MNENRKEEEVKGSAAWNTPLTTALLSVDGTDWWYDSTLSPSSRLLIV